MSIQSFPHYPSQTIIAFCSPDMIDTAVELLKWAVGGSGSGSLRSDEGREGEWNFVCLAWGLALAIGIWVMGFRINMYRIILGYGCGFRVFFFFDIVVRERPGRGKKKMRGTVCLCYIYPIWTDGHPLTHPLIHLR